MKILFAGTPETAKTVLAGLINSGHEVVAVLTRQDAPIGRKKVITASPVATFAESKGLKVFKVNKITSETITEIQQTGAELGIVVAYGAILKKEALEAITQGWFNLHFSKLPKYRGAAPVQWSIVNGETDTAVTMFQLDEGMDTGPVLGVAETVINPSETTTELLARLAQLGVSLLNQELPKIYSGMIELKPQIGEVSLAPKPSREDARLDFDLSAEVNLKKIRGFNPEPGTWCIYNEQPFKVLEAKIHLDPVKSNPGDIRNANGSLLVDCGEGTALELLSVQPSSKAVMTGKQWLNGLQTLGRFS